MVRVNALEVDFIIILYIYAVPLLSAYTVRTYVQYITTLGVYVQYCKYIFYTLLVVNVSVYPFLQTTRHTRCVLCPTRVQSEGG